MILAFIGYIVIMAMLIYVIKNLLKIVETAQLEDKFFLNMVTLVFVFMGAALTVAGIVAVSLRAGHT